ncbi:glutamyl-tRNA reductase [Halogranum amylolyticum]|uniref:Glutamyl-tRNA reductase n=1 Tax=Halogranum amylolyticum TaxID=660520 RepID=A0A1H8NJ20_9EURY|nr:glutamyl-tRNA reductase [Halogranum amylolyticum]SEO29587.1 glutamyl-tRNA reductase [Halogranum amylolyticum]
MRYGGVITGVTVSHSNATIDEIEAACREDERTFVESLLARDGVDEAFVVQTCNRAEAYVVTSKAARGRQILAEFAPDVRDSAVVEMDHEESIRHLMCVAAGLDSLVIGEDQIIGQLKTALAEARAVGGIGEMLDETLTKAIHVGERARTETAINEGVVSLGSAAVELAERTLELDGKTALVVGAGEMGTLAARALDGTGVERVLVANRTVPHAEHVASEIETAASAVALDAVPAATATADLVITATGSPSYVLDVTSLTEAGETLVIDLAQPRDVDPTVRKVDDVTFHDIDTLEAVTESTRERRETEAEKVYEMIDEEFDRLLDAYKRKRADDAISTMYESAEAVKSREVDTALSKLEAQGELTDEQRETVTAMADALVGQLLSAPTKSLRDAAAEDDWTTIQTAMQLFDPEFGGDPPELPDSAMPREGAPDEIPEGVDRPDQLLDHLSND